MGKSRSRSRSRSRSPSRSRKSDSSHGICREYIPADAAEPGGYNPTTDTGIFTLSCCRRSIICISVFNILFNLVGIFATINTITKKQLTKGETISNVFEIIFDIIDSVVWACAIYAILKNKYKFLSPALAWTIITLLFTIFRTAKYFAEESLLGFTIGLFGIFGVFIYAFRLFALLKIYKYMSGIF